MTAARLSGAAMPSRNLGPCPDCGHAVSRLAVACPACGRPIAKAVAREGLFLRTMNQGTALVFWAIVFLAVFPLVIGAVGALWWQLGR